MKKQEHLTVVGYLKQSYDHFVEENKKLKRKLDEESKLWSELKKENKQLKKENKEYKDTMNQMVKELWKLNELVDKLREAIEEEKN
jgi:predicted nuclease with TOPRIM domain